MKNQKQQVLLAACITLIFAISASAQTLQQVVDNGNSTTKHIEHSSSVGLRLVNSNITPAAGVYNAISLGQYGGSSQQIRFVPYSTFDNDYLWNNDFSFDFLNNYWRIDGTTYLLSISSGPSLIIENTVSDANIKLVNGDGTVGNIAYDNGTDGLEFRTDGATRFYVGDDGKVGVGTTTPSELLQVTGAAHIHNQVGGIKFDAVPSVSQNGYVRSSILSSRDADLEWDDVNNQWTLGSGSNSNDFAAIIHRSTGELSFSTGTASAFSSLSDGEFRDQYERLTILGEGNVGIGTSAPVDHLHIEYDDADVYSSTTMQDNGVRIRNRNNSLNDGMFSSLRFLASANNGNKNANGAINLIQLNSNKHTSDFSFQLRNSGGDYLEVMRMRSTGNVGIGTTTPRERLEVDGSILVQDAVSSDPAARMAGFYPYKDKAYGMELHYQQSKWGLAVFARNGSDIRLGHYSADETQQDNLDAKIVVKADGNIGIGTNSPDEKLTVKGKIHTEEVKVDLSVPAPDYVFEEEYDLPTLESIEKFIKSEKHLPEIPSAAEMEENGVELGTMNMLLLKKIEELTLYTLEQESKLEDQSNQIQKLQSNNDQLRAETNELSHDLTESRQQFSNELAAYNLQLTTLLKRLENLENQ